MLILSVYINGSNLHNMMRPIQQILILLVLIILIGTGCHRNPLEVDISDIGTEVSLERFDLEIFEIDMDTVDRAIGFFYKAYGDFFDIYNVHIINIGLASNRHYPAYLSMFLNDPTNREVYEYTSGIFSEVEKIDSQVNSGFRHYVYHYPDSVPPRIVGYVSGFNQGLFTVDGFVGVGLDQYLGSKCSYYDHLKIPRYHTLYKRPDKIPSDLMYAWASHIYPYNDSLDNVLTRMIHQGMLYYFVDAMYPLMEDSLKIGFTSGQTAWCNHNEEQMWTYLVEKKLLFSTDPLVIRKLVEDAPNTQYFTSESPGRAAVWQGWQIIRAYVKRHPELALHEVMSMRDYQEILRTSRYNP